MNRWAIVLLAALIVSLSSGCTGLVKGSTNAVLVAPAIMAQPTSQTVTAGQSATFSVAATGTAPITYQWKKNSISISGANSSSYTTPATTSSDNGAQFSVMVSNSAGSATSSSAMLTVSAAAVAPSITAQPASQTVTAGQTATFSVAATGTAPLTYQWQRNSVSITGANSSSYTTPATTSSDNGAQFSVMVSNSAGSATSSSAMLTVSAAAVAPSITAQPASQTVTAGQTATFSVAATGTAPLTYQWQRNSVSITGANSSSYTTPATTSSDNGAQFAVVVSNAPGSATSSSAMLTVSAAAVAPSITAQPASQTVTAGQTATFSVAATGTAPLTYQWQRNSVSITGANSSSYTTPATTSSDNGAQFAVVVSNAPGSATSSSAMLTVSAAAVAPSITAQPASQTVTAGQTATFSVAATGTAPLTYQWQRNSVSITGANSSSYTTPATTSSDNGAQFAVVVSNAPGSVTSGGATLTVNAASSPLQITTTQLPGGTVASSYNAALSALGGSAPYTWSLLTGALPNGLAIDAGGTISGTPILASLFSFTVQVQDAKGATASSSSLAITVGNGSLASDCTLYASPSGSSGNSGTTPSAPKSFSGAASATGPGSVVCLLGGTYSLSSTFSPPASGTPSSWIVYKAYGDSPVYINYTGAPTGDSMFSFQGGSFPSNPAYLEFRDLNLNGQGNALDGFICNGSHHLRFIGNSVSNTGGSGISTVRCDYITADHNVINHNGYIPAGAQNLSWWSWTSGISYNTSLWFDNYAGLHNIISNNIVVGEFDNTSNHTDGNGIILDLGGNTPPALIVNNVVYGNGGRCIQPNYVQNFYVINNTCYKNNLDPNEPSFPSIGFNGASNGYVVNNIAYSWNSAYPAYGEYNGSSNIFFYTNLLYGASYNFSYSDPSQFIQADPLFVSAPSLSQGGYSSAMPASELGTALTLLPLTPAYSRGIDPSTLSGLSSAIISDLKNYIYTDMNGKARPQGGSVDLGAYQH